MRLGCVSPTIENHANMFLHLWDSDAYRQQLKAMEIFDYLIIRETLMRVTKNWKSSQCFSCIYETQTRAINRESCKYFCDNFVSFRCLLPRIESFPLFSSLRCVLKTIKNLRNFFPVFVRLGCVLSTIENHANIFPVFVRLVCMSLIIENFANIFPLCVRLRCMSQQSRMLEMFFQYLWDSDACNQQSRIMIIIFCICETRMRVISNRE